MVARNAVDICTADIADNIVNQAVEIIGTNHSPDLTVLRGILDLSSHIRTADTGIVFQATNQTAEALFVCSSTCQNGHIRHALTQQGISSLEVGNQTADIISLVLLVIGLDSSCKGAVGDLAITCNNDQTSRLRSIAHYRHSTLGRNIRDLRIICTTGQSSRVIGADNIDLFQVQIRNRGTAFEIFKQRFG